MQDAEKKTKSCVILNRVCASFVINIIIEIYLKYQKTEINNNNNIRRQSNNGFNGTKFNFTCFGSLW